MGIQNSRLKKTAILISLFLIIAFQNCSSRNIISGSNSSASSGSSNGSNGSGGGGGNGTVFPAASCATSDVQAAINLATEGSTVTIPAGTCSWTTGVTLSGKGIKIQGAGSGKIVGYSASSQTLATGTKTLSVNSSRVTD